MRTSTSLHSCIAPDSFPPDAACSPHADRLHRLTQAVISMLHTAADLVRRSCARWARRRVGRATYRALCELDARALRDLGFDRSELMSVAAELAGDAPITRAREGSALRGLAGERNFVATPGGAP